MANDTIEWKTSPSLVAYPQAVEMMEQRVADIISGRASELVWLLEHPPLYTAGTSAKSTGLLDGTRFPVYDTGRGGEHTYHGPGQRVAYVMLDLKKRNAMDVRRYVQSLEQWIIDTLTTFGVEGFVREGRVGVWVNKVSDIGNQKLEKNNPTPDSRHLIPDFSEAKIAALGIRVRKWVTYHGICINVNPDLSHYSGIVPCGISQYGVTSLHALGTEATMDALDHALKQQFEKTVLPSR